MRTFVTVAAGILLVAGTGAALAQGGPAAPALATGVCSACHGPEGHSISPVFPRLAGQQAAYIELQLRAFRDHERADPNARAYMWGMASQLSNEQIKQLAGYYAAQKPSPGEAGPPALMAEGSKIYSDGIASEKVAACASCHGPEAKGNKAFPRLAGQHVGYLISQLEGFKSGLRSNAPIMMNEVHNMTESQMRAAATYAASK